MSLTESKLLSQDMGLQEVTPCPRANLRRFQSQPQHLPNVACREKHIRPPIVPTHLASVLLANPQHPTLLQLDNAAIIDAEDGKSVSLPSAVCVDRMSRKQVQRRETHKRDSPCRRAHSLLIYIPPSLHCCSFFDMTIIPFPRTIQFVAGGPAHMSKS